MGDTATDESAVAAAAALRQRDLVQWIENKFGTSDDDGHGWSSASLTQHIDGDLIEAVASSCYSQLATVSKQRLLLAIMHAAPSQLDAWTQQIAQLIDCTRNDPEEWMVVLGQLLGDYGRRRVFNANDEADAHVSHACAELRQTGGWKHCPFTVLQ